MSRPIPPNINGHEWIFRPALPNAGEKYANIGSIVCKNCLTSYDMGSGKNYKCEPVMRKNAAKTR